MELEFTGNMSKELKSCYDKRMEISKVWNLEINEKKSLLLKAIFMEKGYAKYAIDLDMIQFIKCKIIGKWEAFYIYDENLKSNIFVTAIKSIYDLKETILTVSFETTDVEPIDINYTD